jgi:hypothetical protein
MSRWWRAYDDALHDPKVQSLPAELFKRWFNLLCVASKTGGYLPPSSELGRLLGRRLDYLQADIQHLCKCGLLDEIEGKIIPHNWFKRQYKSDSSTERVKRFRNVAMAVSETAPEYRVQKERKESSSSGNGHDDGFALFWQAYPRKVGKKAAKKALRIALRDASLPTILAALEKQKNQKQWRNPDLIPHPTTWLNQGRWADEGSDSPADDWRLAIT